MPEPLTEQELEIIRQGTQNDGLPVTKKTILRNAMVFSGLFILFVLLAYLMVYWASQIWPDAV